MLILFREATSEAVDRFLVSFLCADGQGCEVWSAGSHRTAKGQERVVDDKLHRVH